jgi:hypothetical protein
MSGFFTDKNGVVRPITKRKAGGAVVAGAVLAGLVTFAGGGGPTASVGAALDSAAATDANTTASQRDAAKGDEKGAWQRLALREAKKAVRQRLRCAVQSTGQVRQYFLRTGCDSLKETLLMLGDAHGNDLVVSVSWVKMSSSGGATGLKNLEDVYGTGDITPLPTEVLGLGGVRFTGRHYAARQNGTLVVVSEAEAVRGHPSTALLDDVAKVGVVLPA